MAKKKAAKGSIPTTGEARESVFSRVSIERLQSHQTRQKLFQRIERLIRRPVVSFLTSFLFPVSIEDHDADMLEGVLRTVDTANGLALLISSPGGDGEAAERIVNICRSYSGTGEYWAIVPGKAKSAATMICFGASRIIMGPSSELGPVDPQIIYAEDGVRKQLSAYNIVTSYEELFEKAVETPGRIEPFLQQLDHYDARDVKRFKEAIALADDISVKTLKTGMMKRLKEDTIRKKIARFLEPERTKSHGRPIFRDEAKECGLNIVNASIDSERWDLIYELYYRSNSLVSDRAMKCLESATDSVHVPLPQELS